MGARAQYPFIHSTATRTGPLHTLCRKGPVVSGAFRFACLRARGPRFLFRFHVFFQQGYPPFQLKDPFFHPNPPFTLGRPFREPDRRSFHYSASEKTA